MTFTLYVHPLSHLSNECIRRTFSEFGEVIDVHVPRTFATKKRQSFGYIKYRDKHAAARAISALHGKSLFGHIMEVVWADQSAKTPEEMAERKRRRREEWLRRQEEDGQPPPPLPAPRQERRDVPLHEKFFTAVDYPEGVGDEFTPLYQKNLPPVGQRKQFFSWVYVPDEQREKILKEELEKQIAKKRRRSGGNDAE
jgi:RNA recognition motif-containing protein